MRAGAYRRKFSVLAFCSLVLANAVPLSSVAYAEEEIVASIVHGGNPYLIHMHTTDSPAGRQGPGIYVRQKDSDGTTTQSNNWVLAIPGNVLPVPVRGGLLAQFELSKYTDRFDAATVVDGALTLFSVKSTPDEQASVAKLGSGAFKVIDPVDGAVVQLPTVLRYEDITLHAVNTRAHDGRSHDNVEIVVCSIKGLSPKGTGVTFAFTLKSGQNRDDGVVPASPPVLLSWQFEEQNDLSRYISEDESVNLLAPSYWRSLIMPRPGDEVAVANWRTSLKRELEDFEKNGYADEEIVPYINALTGAIGIGTLPSDRMRAGLMAIFDPLYGRSGVYLTSGEDDYRYPGLENQTPVMSGTPICDEDGCVVVSEVRLSNHDVVATTMRDGRIALFTTIDDVGYVQMLRPTRTELSQASPTNVSWICMPGQNVIVASWQTAKGSQTVAFHIEVRPEGFALLGSVVLADRRYFSREELAARLHMRALSTQNSNKSLLFDAYTRVETTVPSGDDSEGGFNLSAYSEAHSMSMPHIDISGTLADPNRSVQTVFPDPKRTVEFSRYLVYREYEVPEGYESQTGLYTKGPQSVLVKQIKMDQWPVMQVSPRLNAEHVTSGILDQAILDDLDRVPNTYLSVISSETYFHLVAEVDSTGVKPQVETLLRHTTFPRAPGEQHTPLQYIRLYRLDGFAQKAPEQKTETYKATFPIPFMLVYASQRGNTTIYTFDLHRNADVDPSGAQRGGPAFKIGSGTIRQLSNSVLDLPVIESRLRFSFKGEAYYVNTPELEPDHPNYELVRLSNWEKLYPSRMAARTTFYTYAQRQKPMPVVQERQGGSAWRVWPTDTRFAELIKKVRHSSEYQVDLIPQLRDLLEDLANPNKPPRRVILNVPPELKSLVENLVHFIRSSKEHKGHWSDTGTALRLYSVNGVSLDQPETMSALLSIRTEAEISGVRPVLFATASQIVERHTPRLVEINGEESGFRLEATALSPVLSSHPDADADTAPITDHISSTDHTLPPSLMYLMATEGRRIQTTEFRQTPPAPTYSTLIIGTPTENAVLTNRNKIEEYIGMVDLAYERVTIDAPSRAHREGRVLQLFGRPEVRAMGIRFNAEGLLASDTSVTSADETSQAAALQALATYLVNKAETLSTRHGLSIHTGFNRVMQTLVMTLSQVAPSTASRTVLFDRPTVELLFSRVFPMSLNINLLPETDPLKILYRHNEGQQPGEEAAFLWTMSGYFSDKKLKMDVIKIILNQLSADEGRNVSSSFILMGGTGSGKTSLITSLLFDVLKLKAYKFGAEPSINRESQVFFLEMSKVIDDKSAARAAAGAGEGITNDQGSISLTDAMAELDKFLSSPLGYRGFIVLDDLHLAPPAVRSRFISRLRSFQDSQTYSVMGPLKKMVEYPTRNLIPIITLNPTENRERIAKFASSSSKPTDAELILATLSSADGSADIDPSFLSRFSRVIKVENFPPEAKAPKLSLTTRTMARDILENDGRFVAVSQAAIQRIAQKFPNMNAREFISSATRALTSHARNAVGTAFVVVPRTAEDGRGRTVDPYESRFRAVGAEGAAEIEAFAEENFTVLSLGSPRDFRARLGLLSYVVANGRVNLLRTLLLSMYDDRQFSGSAMSMRYWLAPLAQAINDHVTQLPTLNMQDVHVSALDLGLTREEDRRALSRSLIAAGSTTSRDFVFPSLGQTRLENVAASFLGREAVEYSRTRQDVMRETVAELTPIVEELLNAVFQTQSVAMAAGNPVVWLQGLGIDKRDYVKDFGSKLIDGLVNFSREMRDISRRQDQRELSEYDVMRLYVTALDMAYAKQPWSNVLKLVEGSIGALTQNIALAQTPGVQKFLFESNRSPLVAQDAGVLRMIASSVPYYDEAPSADNRNNFPSRCAELLRPVRQTDNR